MAIAADRQTGGELIQNCFPYIVSNKFGLIEHKLFHDKKKSGRQWPGACDGERVIIIT